jgi:hypothetical protein
MLKLQNKIIIQNNEKTFILLSCSDLQKLLQKNKIKVF